MLFLFPKNTSRVIFGNRLILRLNFSYLYKNNKNGRLTMWRLLDFLHKCLLLIRLHYQQEYLFCNSINGQQNKTKNTMVMFIKRLNVHILVNQCSQNG